MDNEEVDMSSRPQGVQQPSTGVSFEDYRPVQRSMAHKTSMMIRWVIKLSGGMIEDERKAEYVLIGFAIIVFAISMFIFFNSSSTDSSVSPEKYKNIDQSNFSKFTM